MVKPGALELTVRVAFVVAEPAIEPAFAIRPSDAIASDTLKLGDMGLAVAAAYLALEKILRTDKLAYTSC